MSETKSELDEMEQTNYSINSNTMDPKNNEELIIYVSLSSLFTLNKFFLFLFEFYKNFAKVLLCWFLNLFLIIQVQSLLQNVQDRFQSMSEQIISRIDDMGNR